jgi:hypothetical protein
MAEKREDSAFSFSSAGTGAFAVTQGTSRTEMLYALYENDLDTLSVYDNGSVLSFSLGGIFFGTTISTFIGWLIQRATAGGPASQQTAGILAGVYGVLTIVFVVFAVGAYIIGAVLLRKRGTLLKRIKSKSIPIPREQLPSN